VNTESLDSENVRVSLTIQVGNLRKSMESKIQREAINQSRYDLIAHHVDAMLSQIRFYFGCWLEEGARQHETDRASLEIKLALLDRQNDALLKDKERYEWLKDGKGSHWAYNYLRDNFRINDDAIDAARAKKGGAT
jgi:hypothetical protein